MYDVPMHPPGHGPSHGYDTVAVGTGDAHPGTSEMVDSARHALRMHVGHEKAVSVTVGQSGAGVVMTLSRLA